MLIASPRCRITLRSHLYQSVTPNKTEVRQANKATSIFRSRLILHKEVTMVTLSTWVEVIKDSEVLQAEKDQFKIKSI